LPKGAAARTCACATVHPKKVHVRQAHRGSYGEAAERRRQDSGVVVEGSRVAGDQVMVLDEKKDVAQGVECVEELLSAGAGQDSGAVVKGSRVDRAGDQVMVWDEKEDVAQGVECVEELLSVGVIKMPRSWCGLQGALF